MSDKSDKDKKRKSPQTEADERTQSLLNLLDMGAELIRPEDNSKVGEE